MYFLFTLSWIGVSCMLRTGCAAGALCEFQLAVGGWDRARLCERNIFALIRITACSVKTCKNGKSRELERQY